MEMPANGVGRRVLAVFTAVVMVASFVGLLASQANAVVAEDVCFEEVVQYRAEKQQLVSGNWVRAAEGLQLHGPDQWVDDRPNLSGRPAGPWVEGDNGEWTSTNMPGYKYVIFERTVDGDQIPCETGWACVGGEVVFIPNTDNFDGDETIYGSEEEAAADPNCVDDETTTTTVPEETTTTVPDEETTTTVDVDDTEETTTTTIEDEVLGEEVTTTTASDEVVAEELPFTGVENGALAAIAGALASLGLLVTLAARRIEE